MCSFSYWSLIRTESALNPRLMKHLPSPSAPLLLELDLLLRASITHGHTQGLTLSLAVSFQDRPEVQSDPVE